MKNLFASALILLSASAATAETSAFEMTINITMADIYCNYEMPDEVIDAVAGEAAMIADIDARSLARVAIKQADERAAKMSAIEMRNFCQTVKIFYQKLGYYFY